jgi:hypothetical protein
MSNSLWPDIAIRISSAEELAHFRAADRAIVFLTVDWSAPERKSRACFQRLVEMLSGLAIPSVEFFVINEDDDAVRQQLPDSVGCSCAPLGAGTVFWLERGQVIAGEINAGSVGHDRLFERTAALWPSLPTAGEAR